MYKNVCLRPLSLPSVSGSDYAIFSCGSCASCLKRKGRELAVRLFRECQCCSRDVFLLTFTYDNEHLPILATDEVIEVDSGEVIYSRSFYCDDIFGISGQAARTQACRSSNPYSISYQTQVRHCQSP